MAFLKYMDSLALVTAMLIIIIMVYKISHKNSPELTLWFAGSIGLVTSIFLTTTGKLTYVAEVVEEVENSIIDPFFITILALTLALISSSSIFALDRSKKFAPYYTLVSIILALITGYVAVYQDVTAEVLLKPLFTTLLIVSLLIIFITPIIAVIKQKANYHSLWGLLGWAGLLFAAWTQWSAFTGRIIVDKTTQDAFDSRLFTALFIGVLGIALDYALTKWKHLA